MGWIDRNEDISYYSDDILCDYKVPISCGIYKTLYCKSNNKDLKSLSVLNNCGCKILDLEAKYGERIYFERECNKSVITMSGYERLILGMRIDINSANLLDLISIDGIGESIAERIVNYRIKNGRFERIEDLKEIKGIGKNNLSRISKFICIDCSNK